MTNYIKLQDDFLGIEEVLALRKTYIDDENALNRANHIKEMVDKLSCRSKYEWLDLYIHELIESLKISKANYESAKSTYFEDLDECAISWILRFVEECGDKIDQCLKV